MGTGGSMLCWQMSFDPNTRPFMRNVFRPGFSVIVCLFGLAPLLCGQATLTDLQEVRQGYIDANGGADNLAEIQSLRVFGTLEEGGETYEVALVKKRPYYKRIILRHVQNDLTISHNGEQTWRLFERHGAPVMFEVMEGEDAFRFESDRDFDSPLVAGPREGQQMRLAPPERIGRSQYYVVEITEDDDRMEILIEPRTFKEYLTRSYSFVDGERVVMESRFYDYQKVNDVWVAMRVERYRNGEHVSEMRLKRAEMNPGVFNSFFDPPRISAEGLREN